MNAQPPGPLSIVGDLTPQLRAPLPGGSRVLANVIARGTDPETRLLAAAYTMADRAGRVLGVDAADLCAKLDLAALIKAAQTAVDVLEQGTDWRDLSPSLAADHLRNTLPPVFPEPRQS